MRRAIITLAAVIAIVALVQPSHAGDCPVTGTDKATRVITLTADQINAMVDSHDYYKTHLPGGMVADDTHLYEWNAAIANNALTYAKKCIWQHTQQCYRSNVANQAYLGENLAARSTGGTDLDMINKMITSWADERFYYHFDTNACDAGKMCGHYTQMVWAATTMLGCGVVICPPGTVLGSFEAAYLVCQYGPGGNYQGQKPLHIADGKSPCYSHPCGDDGSCVATGSSYTCECPPGKTSPNGNQPCVASTGPPTSTNPCDNSNSCSGHGVCNRDATKPGGYVCTCSAGWSGGHCETMNDVCQNNPCVHGQCKAGTGGKYACVCDLHWHGTNCDVEDDPCDPNPCENGGTCSKTGNYGYACACKTGWKGVVCHDPATTPTVAPTVAPTTAPTTAPIAPKPATASPGTAFLKALWSLILKDTPKVQWNENRRVQAQAEADKCPTVKANIPNAYESVLRLCQLNVADPGDAFGSTVYGYWKGVDKWWGWASIVNAGCAVSNKDCTGACGGANTWRALVCVYGSQPAEWETFAPSADVFDMPVQQQSARGFGPVVLGVGAVCLAAGVALAGIAVAVRRRRQAEGVQYVEMDEQLVA